MSAPHSSEEPQAEGPPSAPQTDTPDGDPQGLSVGQRRLIKRDGSEVPFDSGRIEAAVLRALVAVGEDDSGFARDVAEVVTLALA
ncbi:MAG: ATP cone domain-containing protein, partial [Planctomycetota bacterium]|nr:ATP cone domain-containing protein [Planctomycetota bacterium]